jgi:hypothetical protein
MACTDSGAMGSRVSAPRLADGSNLGGWLWRDLFFRGFGCIGCLALLTCHGVETAVLLCEIQGSESVRSSSHGSPYVAPRPGRSG